MISTTDNIYATRVMYMLLKPFNKQKAFKLGIIDSDGKKIKEPKTKAEEDSYTLLHQLAFELKKVINKLPGNEYRVKQIAMAMQLLNRKNIPSQYLQNLTEVRVDYLKKLNFILENEITLIEEEFLIESLLENVYKMTEEGEGGVVNSTAGISAAPGEEAVVIDPKKKKGNKYDSIINP